jgi:hypothetical protein
MKLISYFFHVLFVENIDEDKKDESNKILLEMYSEEINFFFFKTKCYTICILSIAKTLYHRNLPLHFTRSLLNGFIATFPNIKTILTFFFSVAHIRCNRWKKVQFLITANYYLRSVISQEHLKSLAVLATAVWHCKTYRVSQKCIQKAASN